MFDKQAEQLAIQYGIYDRIVKLDSDLSIIPNIVHIEYDIRCYNDLRQIILVPKYNFDHHRDMHHLFEMRSEQIFRIQSVCKDHGLYPTGDRIEDYGEHWYIVRQCGNTWN